MQNRNNFFDWSRLVFAALVMLSHSLVLKTGNEADWFASWFGQETLGSIGVKGFFILSGYFVLPALLTDESSSRHYVFSRIFRIYPGLIFCVLACVALGFFLSTTPHSEYIKSKEVWQYVFYNGLALEPRFSLPGVFPENPWPNSVNGSLWTLPLEIRCYLLLLVMWFFGFFKEHKVAGLALLVVFISGMSNAAWISQAFNNQNAGPYVACFSLGSLFRLYGWDKRLSTSSVAIALLAMIWFWHSPVHHVVFGVALASVIFYASHINNLVKYIPTLPEDISYGIYLYAYPVQQSLVFFKPEWSLSSQLIVSFLLVLLLAYLTRVLIEKPFLKIKDSILQRT